ncbi:hypothetical protein FRAHR75_1040025 [Frankia sp. Hr75.2]|nr:hypothetical protein FRAHR75_1040025 [Frankia sp. Hr75.2]
MSYLAGALRNTPVRALAGLRVTRNATGGFERSSQHSRQTRGVEMGRRGRKRQSEVETEHWRLALSGWGRRRIATLREQSHRIREITQRLGRTASTVGRIVELRGLEPLASREHHRPEKRSRTWGSGGRPPGRHDEALRRRSKHR